MKIELHGKITQELKELYKKMDAQGKLPSRKQLDQYYETFHRRFGPDVLSNLDGEVLLETVHGRGNQNSLVYWLEFKNDEEFPAIFGSIAGGSALKFGIYHRKETETWMTGSPQNQLELSIEEAVQIARKHRDQLIHGCELLENMPSGGSDEDYRILQEEMDREAPNVSSTAWGHKYYSLLYPNKLDDFHVEYFQRFHLIKLLQLPPDGVGRYLAAVRYVAIATELDIPIKHLTTLLNDRNGRPHRYWRVLVNYPDQPGFKNNWEAMRNGGYVAIGWEKLGDLSIVDFNQDSKNQVRSLMKTNYSDKGSWADEIFNFVAGMQEGDLVLAFERSTVLGIGRITSPYQYDTSIPQIPHHHPVEWLSIGQWGLPAEEAKGRAIKELRLPENLVEIEKHLLNPQPLPPIAPVIPLIPKLTGTPGRIQSVLDRKKQAILYGPPG
ncbi:MAG: AAA family ATPase, partial [Anaerolineales bacterium]|nr:AAA family ATPase [Anaerolineales bacterium]